MSWIRSAVNRAIEVGGRGSNLTGTVRGYADSVVQHAGYAVIEGAKIFHDRLGARNFQSLKQTIKRLEEVSVSCRGAERTQLLRRWLVALKEIERLTEDYHGDYEKSPKLSQTSDESKDSPTKPLLALYYDNDLGGEPLNFRDAFLLSQAVEGITLSMILEAPNEEEASLLLEIFGMCLTGAKEVHNAILCSIQDLAKIFSSYQDEVLVKREELLQLAQNAIAGLKINADLSRIDAEASSLHKKLENMKGTQHSSSESHETSDLESALPTVEAIRQSLVQIQLCSRLETLLLKKKSLKNGDSPDSHAQKVDKLKVLSESLGGSIIKAEKRIEDNRFEKEEAVNYRVVKTGEVSQLEKDLTIEIGELQKRRDELEVELKKVNSMLTGALARLRNAKEERQHFDEASNQMVVHLKIKEDELLRSVACFRVEADVVNRWISFLEDTWVVQSLYIEQKEKHVNDELDKYQEYFVDLVICILSKYKAELGPSIAQFRKLVDNLNSSEGSEIARSMDIENSSRANPRKKLEEEYIDFEAKFIFVFSLVDSTKKQFYDRSDSFLRKDNQRVAELFDALQKIKEEFESIKRPVMEIETPKKIARTASKKESRKSPFAPMLTNKAIRVENVLDTDAELANLESEVGKLCRNYSAEEISDWEFDALDEDLKSSTSFGRK